MTNTSDVSPTADELPLPIGDQLARLAAQSPDAPSVTCDGVTLTRRELDRSTNRLARAYEELGVRQGDYVTIVLPNGIEWVQAAVAAWKLGATVTPLSARLPESEFAAIMALVPRALVVGRDTAGLAEASVPAGFEPPASLSDEPVPSRVAPSWKALPSGGSTGRSKLIEATEDSRLDPRMVAAAFGLRPGTTQLVVGPLTHNSPFVALINGLLVGQHAVVMSRFDPRECLRLIAEYRVGWISTVPTVLQRLLPVHRADPDAYDLSSIERVWHLGAACAPELKQAWMDILGPEKVWELYGGTEATALTVINGVDWLAHRGSVGKVAIGRMTVLDEEGTECPPGTVGEIYMKPPEGVGATYRYIGSESVTRDGWETIGDLGWFDEDGYLYISDRRVDMFNVGGRKVYPSEIEVVLNAHPAVLSSLVVGIPDSDLGAVGYALVEADPAAGLNEDVASAYLAERLPAYKMPRYFEFRDEPLRDLAGKARRSAVRDEVIARMGTSTGN
ncbi:AMP-binding protein [Nocardia sp. NPDC058176]|uniref:AMP-binding protein n=1 Tax=Nocardia sp. NPDC058176 TaxID=3346368 RepID=UPI0036DAAC26